MKFKRIAVVAAAAVVGPTVLMATPAMADEVKNPAVSTPDAAPKDDTVQSRADAGQQTPWAPGLSLANLPAAGFVAGSDWSEFSVKVDNRGGPSVSGYALELGVTGSGLGSSHFDVEVFYAGAWHKAERAALPGPDAPVYDATPGLTYGADSLTDVKMRMRAKADAPAGDITITVTGTDNRDADSKAAPFASKVTHGQAGGGDGDGATAGAPALSLSGMPQKGFKAGADWSEFSLHVDNAGRQGVDDYSLEMVMWTLDTTGFEDGDAQLEVYAPGAGGTWGWHKIEAYGSEEAWSFSLAEVDINPNEVFDLKLRMKFAKDAPATRLSLSTTAEGGTAPRVKHSTSLTADDQQTERQGPKLGLDGLPQGGFVAGGDWQQLALHVDNSGKEAIDKYSFTFYLFPDGKNVLRAEHFDIEAWNGAAWVPLPKHMQEPGAAFDWAVGKNAKFDIQLRVRAVAGTPDSPILVILYADSNGSEHPVESDMVVKATSVHGVGTGTDTGTDTGTGTGTGTETGGNGGNQPAPDGGAKPAGTTSTDPAATTATTASNGTGEQLARTGADPATSWALGASGVALAMGAALVAGTGRRRRPTA
ncbi:hypothetical protein SAVIM338S_00373 [Streptomyces avidinii]